ncbi:MAG: hypothetical protein ACRDK7_11270, partial [Solirubrobacteraceae bacterium]
TSPPPPSSRPRRHTGQPGQNRPKPCNHAIFRLFVCLTSAELRLEFQFDQQRRILRVTVADADMLPALDAIADGFTAAQRATPKAAP